MHWFLFLAAVAECSTAANVFVNTTVTFQELDGFGVSQAFQRAYDVFGKDGLSPANTTFVLDLMFDVEKGAGFSILRNGIGSSNTSQSNLMKSIEPISPGSPEAPPHYIWDRNESGQYPLAVEAYNRGLRHLYGNAWSAPGYMKTNHDENNGGYLCGVANATCSTGSWVKAYADYLIQWARFYKQSGVKVTELGFLNEPQFPATYAGMLSNGSQAAEVIRALAHEVKSSGMNLDITCCDGIGWDDQRDMMPGLQAGADPAENYLGVVTGHGYSSAPTYPLKTKKKTWLTEWADLSGQFTPYTFYNKSGPGEGMTWASHIQVALVHANVSGFLYWIGAENSTTNSGLINLAGDEVIPSKRFWAFAQFSKFARPGARRVQATSTVPKLQISSFLNLDGSIATQMINNGTTACDVEVALSGAKCSRYRHVRPYLTNNEHDLTALSKIGVQRGIFKATVPARSLMSFVTES